MTTGAYLLIAEVKQEELVIKIGGLGLITFKKGFFCYCGSAMGKGSTSLEKRVFRHVKTSFKSPDAEYVLPKIHWHIDYFLSDPDVKLIKIAMIPSQIKEECSIAQQIFSSQSCEIISNFGSSDCKCDGHLAYLKTLNGFFN